MKEFEINYYNCNYDELIPIMKYLIDGHVKLNSDIFIVNLKDYIITYEVKVRQYVADCYSDHILLHCKSKYSSNKYGLMLMKSELCDIIKIYDEQSIITNKKIFKNLHSFLIKTIEASEKEHTK